MTRIQVKRVYDDLSGTSATDGFRIFVDRLWPRGESKETFHYDLWAKDIAPSTELREWYHADSATRWNAFAARYTAELKANPAMPDFIELMKAHKLVTLLYSSRDEEHNNADVLAEYLKEKI